ncbi:MAG: helix-turn-helix transcriptional regulator [Desulfovibrionaceae bacterium]
MEKKLTTQEAAHLLCLAPGTLEVWRSLGRGPKYQKLGRRVVYDQRDLEEFATSRTVHTIDAMPHGRSRRE